MKCQTAGLTQDQGGLWRVGESAAALGCARPMARFHDWFLPRDKASPVFDSAGEELPRWRDPAVLVLLAFVLALELVAWRCADGYPIADSVEFMERAGTFVRGERI